MKQRKPTKTWERTRLQNLIRHKPGRYYARAFAGGKEVWKSLKTSHFSVAEAKLAEFLKEHRERRNNANGEVSAKMTFAEAAAIHLRNPGVDIPTVSRWLGHKDGGALPMKTYGHLRCEHSIAQAQKVSFAPVIAKPADVIPFPARA